MPDETASLPGLSTFDPTDQPDRRDMRFTRRFGIVIASIVLLTATACGAIDEANDDRGKGDAPVGDRDDNPAQVINMPHEFANVAHKCDGHGHRVYVTREPSAARQIAVIDDPSCG